MCPPPALPYRSVSWAQEQVRPQLPSKRDSAGIIFSPPTDVSKAAFALAQSLLPEAVLNHSIRVYLYAKTLSDRSTSKYSKDAVAHDLLFTACIMHDIGIVSKYDGDQRFEVEGADAAVALLREGGVSEEDAQKVWMAIALHTSPGIAERINELSRILRGAVMVDFGGNLTAFHEVGQEEILSLRTTIEQSYPRLGIEKVLGDAIVAQAVKNPDKAPVASWPGNLLRNYFDDPSWDGANKGF